MKNCWVVSELPIPLHRERCISADQRSRTEMFASFSDHLPLCENWQTDRQLVHLSSFRITWRHRSNVAPYLLLSDACRPLVRMEELMTSSSTWWPWVSRSWAFPWHRLNTAGQEQNACEFSEVWCLWTDKCDLRPKGLFTLRTIMTITSVHTNNIIISRTILASTQTENDVNECFCL